MSRPTRYPPRFRDRALDGAAGPVDACRHQAEIRRLSRENASLRQALDLLRDAERSALRRGSEPMSPTGTTTGTTTAASIEAPSGAPTAPAPPGQRTASTVRRRSGQDASR
jgi:hypothetical protein